MLKYPSVVVVSMDMEDWRPWLESNWGLLNPLELVPFVLLVCSGPGEGISVMLAPKRPENLFFFNIVG